MTGAQTRGRERIDFLGSSFLCFDRCFANYTKTEFCQTFHVGNLEALVFDSGLCIFSMFPTSHDYSRYDRPSKEYDNRRKRESSIQQVGLSGTETVNFVQQVDGCRGLSSM